jgi:hypothetical protein
MVVDVSAASSDRASEMAETGSFLSEKPLRV